MQVIRWLCLLVGVALLVGCAQVPQESVELSTTLGRDLLEVQRSHRRAIDLLADRDVERVNRYIDEVATPLYVRTVMAQVGPLLSQSLAKATSPNATPADRDLVTEEMRKIVLGISQRLEQQRRQLVAPIEEARKARLQELDLAYAQMQRANAVITAHLASIMKVNEVQDEALAQAGLQNFRQTVGDTALSLDNEISGALNDAKDVDDAIARIKAIFDKQKAAIKR